MTSAPLPDGGLRTPQTPTTETAEEPWRVRWAGPVGRLLMRMLFSTVRIHRQGHEAIDHMRTAGQPVVFVFWHGQLLPLVHAHRGQGIVVLVSEHADGEIITRIIHRHGFSTARGSSTRGGTRGLRELLRAARSGRDLALTPDGPRGPARSLKPGALTAARISGMPVVPLAVGARRAWYLKSWDRFMVPKPFTRVEIAYGAPVEVPADADEPALERLGAQIEAELERLSQRVGDPRSSFRPDDSSDDRSPGRTKAKGR